MRQEAALLLYAFLGGMRAGRHTEDASEEASGCRQSAPVIAIRRFFVFRSSLAVRVRLRVQVGVVRGDQLISLSDA